MRALVTTLVCLIVAATTHAAAFEGYTDFVGGPGGGRYEDSCTDGGHPDDALVAIDYVSGKDIDRVTAVCAVVRNSQPDAYVRRLDTRGMENDNGAQRVRGNVSCPDGMLIQAIHLTESAVELVHHFWLTCRNPFTGEQKETGETGTFGGQGGSPGGADCGDDAYAYGLRIRADSRINALGLMCAVFRQPAPPPAPPPPPPPPDNTPKPDKPPLKIDNDDNGDQGDGDNGGDGATAAIDTTIYDQPEGNDVAYLSAGDAVTIVGCNDNNWCQISKPHKGWVWGDDLSR